MRVWFVIGSSLGVLMLCSGVIDSGAIAGQMSPQGVPAVGDKGVSAPPPPAIPALADTIAQVAVVTHAVAQIASNAIIVPTTIDAPTVAPADAKVDAAPPAPTPSRDIATEMPRVTKGRLARKVAKTRTDKAKRREELADAHAKPVALRCVGKPETGTAAWYGGRYLGRRTTSGSRLDTIHPTAAHRTLPLNSLARVTNLRNGRSVVVRVTDRGPVADDLLIDMSPRAAEELHMKEAGLVPVRVEQVVEVPADVIADAK